MNELNLAKRQGDFFLCLSLSEDVNLSMFDAYIQNRPDIKSNEIYCLSSDGDCKEERNVLIKSPYILINILFVSLNREGYKKFIILEENPELQPILSRIKKVVVFDGYPFQQLNIKVFLDALCGNLFKFLIPISVGIVCDYNINKDYNEIELSTESDTAFTNYEKQFGRIGVFKIENMILDADLKLIISRQTHPHITRHYRYLQSLENLRFKNIMMLELFNLEFELFLISLIHKVEENKYDEYQISLHIASEFIGIINQNGLKEFQRESSYDSLTSKIHSHCKEIGTQFTVLTQKTRELNYKEIILSACNILANEIHKHIENEIIFWKNEK